MAESTSRPGGFWTRYVSIPQWAIGLLLLGAGAAGVLLFPSRPTGAAGVDSQAYFAAMVKSTREAVARTQAAPSDEAWRTLRRRLDLLDASVAGLGEERSSGAKGRREDRTAWDLGVAAAVTGLILFVPTAFKKPR